MAKFVNEINTKKIKKTIYQYRKKRSKKFFLYIFIILVILGISLILAYLAVNQIY